MTSAWARARSSSSVSSPSFDTRHTEGVPSDAPSSATGDKPGQLDRDTFPTRGIARATGADSLLYSNGAQWRTQKQLAAQKR